MPADEGLATTPGTVTGQTGGWVGICNNDVLHRLLLGARIAGQTRRIMAGGAEAQVLGKDGVPSAEALACVIVTSRTGRARGCLGQVG